MPRGANSSNHLVVKKRRSRLALQTKELQKTEKKKCGRRRRGLEKSFSRKRRRRNLKRG